MVATQATHFTASWVNRDLPARADQAIWRGLVAVLLFAVLNIWTRDRWPISIWQTGIFSLGAVALIRAAWFKTACQISLTQVLLLVPAVIGVLQLALHRSVYPFETLSAAVDWFTLALASWIGFLAFQTSTLRHDFRCFAVWFGGLLAVEATLQLFSGGGRIFWLIQTDEPEALMGPFLNRDHYSTLMVLILPAALWASVTDRKRSWIYGCLGAAMYASVIACASRAGTFLVTLEVLAILIPAAITMPRESRLGAFRTLASLVILIAIFTNVVGWEVVLKRFEQGDPGRLEMWRTAAAMFAARPGLGFGLGTWTTAYLGYARYDALANVAAAHNDWLQWAGEGGIPLLLIMLVIAIRALRLGLRAPWGLGVAFAFAHCLIDFPLQRPAIFLWLIVMLAALETHASKAMLFSAKR